MVHFTTTSYSMHYMYMPPQCRLVRAAPSGAHDHVVTAYTGVSPVSQLFHGVPHPAFTPSTALKPRAAIAYVTQALRLAHGDAESASRATNLERYPALPPDESARPGAALHRTRGNARGGGPWQPWANCRGRPALRPCRMCPAARVGLTSPPGSHTHGAIRKTRGTYNSTWRKSIWRREC